MTKYKLIISLAILIIVYTVGFFGITGAHGQWFASLTPYTLIISALLLAVTHKNFHVRDLLIVLLAAVVGFGMEVAGVSTGKIFGEYYYGENLGYKWMEVPLVIALNWVLLTYCTMNIATEIAGRAVTKALIGASLMVVLDFFIEPIAISLDYWHWKGDEIPLQNYAAWFGIAFVIQLVGHILRPNFKNKFGIIMFMVMTLFFTLLNFEL